MLVKQLLRFHDRTTKKVLYLILPACFVLLQSCSVIELQRPEFHFLTEKYIQEEMTELADSLARVSKHTVNPNMDTPTRRQKVLAELEIIRSIADDMGGDGTITNFAVMNQYMGAFLYDVRTARQQILLDEPDFDAASQLIVSCQGCHSTF